MASWCETIRRWAKKCGPDYARRLRRKQPRRDDIWHLDEAAIKIAGRKYWLWRAVDQDGYVLDEIVQIRRNTKAAKRLLTRLLKKQGGAPKRMITDKLHSYGAARRQVMPGLEHRSHKGLNNRAENSHVPLRRRERVMQGLRSPGSLQRFVSVFSTIRNFLVVSPSELGIVAPQGARNVRQLIAILEDEQHCPEAVRVALAPLVTALTEMETQIAQLDKAILAIHRNNDVSIRLAGVPGIGPVIATWLSASVPDAKLFEGGREFAAWLGLVPRQHSTGGKPRLGAISKMGNRHLRKLLVVGAHAALYRMRKGRSDTPLANWARGLLAKKPFKLVAVALANKIARIAWVIMARNADFQPGYATGNSAKVTASA